ncbi:hypothetical protein B0J11DRAFT_502433 [Dendryphion nanum]|uniref:Uncharacterized protein n=1 Tax=Dendryphion nanum TaxID=256645 RepID=A0A9P9IZ03_9PLEO|nr:hypothetical protein B0J11DRAFT_502433 [Dendryphion nanum]
MPATMTLLSLYTQRPSDPAYCVLYAAVEEEDSGPQRSPVQVHRLRPSNKDGLRCERVLKQAGIHLSRPFSPLIKVDQPSALARMGRSNAHAAPAVELAPSSYPRSRRRITSTSNSTTTGNSDRFSQSFQCSAVQCSGAGAGGLLSSEDLLWLLDVGVDVVVAVGSFLHLLLISSPSVPSSHHSWPTFVFFFTAARGVEARWQPLKEQARERVQPIRRLILTSALKPWTLFPAPCAFILILSSPPHHHHHYHHQPRPHPSSPLPSPKAIHPTATPTPTASTSLQPSSAHIRPPYIPSPPTTTYPPSIPRDPVHNVTSIA